MNQPQKTVNQHKNDSMKNTDAYKVKRKQNDANYIVVIWIQYFSINHINFDR